MKTTTAEVIRLPHPYLLPRSTHEAIEAAASALKQQADDRLAWLLSLPEIEFYDPDTGRPVPLKRLEPVNVTATAPVKQREVIAPKVKKPPEAIAKPPQVGQQLDGTLDDADATVDQMLPTGEAILRAHALIEALTGIRLKLGHSFTRRFERAARRLEGEGRVVIERRGRQSGESNRFSDQAVDLVARAIAARC